MLRKETDIIHLAMGGGGVKKVFTLVEGGFKNFWWLAKGGSKKFDDKNFQLPSPPHQSINEHSLSGEGAWRKKSMCSAPAGPRARTRDLPRARRGSPAARQGGCLDKHAFLCL